MSGNGSVVLPPGPRMPPAMQTAIWFKQAQWLLGQCAIDTPGDVVRHCDLGVGEQGLVDGGQCVEVGLAVRAAGQAYHVVKHSRNVQLCVGADGAPVRLNSARKQPCGDSVLGPRFSGCRMAVASFVAERLARCVAPAASGYAVY